MSEILDARAKTMIASIEAKTGKTTRDFVALATAAGLGDPALKPVYEFANDPSKRQVLYNGVAPDSPAARAALGAALAPLREVLSEVLLAGFAKENIRRQLTQGQVLETGLARPGIDEFTGEGVGSPQSCQGSTQAAGQGSIACQ